MYVYRIAFGGGGRLSPSFFSLPLFDKLNRSDISTNDIRTQNTKFAQKL